MNNPIRPVGSRGERTGPPWASREGLRVIGVVHGAGDERGFCRGERRGADGRGLGCALRLRPLPRGARCLDRGLTKINKCLRNPENHIGS